MNRPNRCPTDYSKMSVKNRTVIPRAVRERLRLKPGDTLRYRVTDDGVLIGKAPAATDGPFTVFSEWVGEADEKGVWQAVTTGASHPSISSSFHSPCADRQSERRRTT